jgi:hypothetical protein
LKRMGTSVEADGDSIKGGGDSVRGGGGAEGGIERGGGVEGRKNLAAGLHE